MPNNELPIIKEELIRYLEKLFPNKCADLKDNERDIFYKSVQRSVVEHLIEKYNLQKEM